MLDLNLNFLINLGFTILIAGVIIFYLRQQIDVVNHKLSSMLSLITTITQNVQNLENSNIVLPTFGGSGENDDGRIMVPEDLKTINITEEEEDEEEDEHEDEDEDEDEEEDEEEEDEEEEEEDDEDEEVEDEEEEEDEDEKTFKIEEVSAMKKEDITAEIKSIGGISTIEPIEEQLFEQVTKIEDNENKQPDYSQLTVPELKKLVSDKGLAKNLKSLKKSDLVELLK